MAKFLLEYQEQGDGTYRPNGWWQIEGDKLVNRVGGYHDYTPAEDDVISEVDSFDDLDYSYMLDVDSPYGWIDLDGTWYGCAYSEHSEVAKRVLHSNDLQLESEGWIKVYRGYPTTCQKWYQRTKFPTEAQRCRLEQLGLM